MKIKDTGIFTEQKGDILSNIIKGDNYEASTLIPEYVNKIIEATFSNIPGVSIGFGSNAHIVTGLEYYEKSYANEAFFSAFLNHFANYEIGQYNFDEFISYLADWIQTNGSQFTVLDSRNSIPSLNNQYGWIPADILNQLQDTTSNTTNNRGTNTVSTTTENHGTTGTTGSNTNASTVKAATTNSGNDTTTLNEHDDIETTNNTTATDTKDLTNTNKEEQDTQATNEKNLTNTNKAVKNIYQSTGENSGEESETQGTEGGNETTSNSGTITTTGTQTGTDKNETTGTGTSKNSRTGTNSTEHASTSNSDTSTDATGSTKTDTTNENNATVDGTTIIDGNSSTNIISRRGTIGEVDANQKFLREYRSVLDFIYKDMISYGLFSYLVN